MLCNSFDQPIWRRRDLIRFLVRGLLLVICLSYAQTVQAEERLIDEVVASVGNTAITYTQVVQETRLILVEKGQYWGGRLPADLLEKVRERLIGKELIYLEFERGVSNASEGLDVAEGNRLRLAFSQQFPSVQEYGRFLQQVELSESALTALLLRNQKIERFIRRRQEMMSRITEDELDQEIERRRKAGLMARDTNVNSEQLREYVRQDIEKQRYDQTLTSWLARLNERYKVRRMTRFQQDVPPVGVKVMDSDKEER